MRKVKTIEGSPDYAVMNDGQVFSIASMQKLKPSTNSNGYKQIRLRKGIDCTRSIHRLVATHFVPNPENKPQVNHIDGDKTNNHYTNLEWCTPKENIKHAKDNGLGEYFDSDSNPKVKIGKDDALEIRMYSDSGMGYNELAVKFGVSYQIVYQVANRITWKHL